MKCEHENVYGRAWSASYPRWYAEFASNRNDTNADALICLDCGAWLSLGPSDETEPNVALEIRAAVLADVCTRTGMTPEWAEYDGWQAHRHSTDFYRGEPTQVRRHWDAGYLARQIATHGDEP